MGFRGYVVRSLRQRLEHLLPMVSVLALYWSSCFTRRAMIVSAVQLLIRWRSASLPRLAVIDALFWVSRV